MAGVDGADVVGHISLADFDDRTGLQPMGENFLGKNFYITMSIL